MKIKAFFLSFLLSCLALVGYENNCPHRFYLGPEFLGLQPHSHINSLQINSSRFFWGFHFGYEYLTPCALYAGVDLLGTGTTTDFDASLDEGDLSWEQAERGFGNFELRLGYTFISFFSFHNTVLLTPFVGVGAYNIFPIDHYHDQGFREDLPYVAAGLRLKYPLFRAFDIGLNMKVLRTFSAEQRFKLSTVTLRSYDNFWGGEIGVPCIWHIGCSGRWDFQLEPYFLKVSSTIYGVRTLFGYNF